MTTSKLYNLIPDATLVCSIATAYILSSTFPIARVEGFLISLIGWVILLSAFGLALSILSDLKSKHTSTDAGGVPSVLLTGGMYRYSRNPFYLLSFLTTIGAGFVLGTITAFVAPIIYFLTLQLIIIPIEEKNLQIQFGREYEKYKHTVRRWV